MAKKPNPQYVEENIQYLINLEGGEGIVSLSNGVMYRVLKSGEGTATPKLNSLVSVYYTGTTIDGKEFDSTGYTGFPATFRLREVIEGWQIALQHMHVGDKWVIYIPAVMGYGGMNIPGIPGGSTLIFEVELLSIN